MLDPERDLNGATPDTLAKALLRPSVKPLRAGAGSEAVVGDQVPVEQVPPEHPGDGVTHLDEGS